LAPLPFAGTISHAAEAVMESGMTEAHAFWDMIEGRRPAPPAAQLLGWRLISFDKDKATINIGFEGKQEFCNPMGAIQGGILTAMLDDTMGPAAMIALDGKGFAQTLELKTSYLSSAAPGRLIGEGRVLKQGREVMFLQGSLKDEKGRLIAEASATARIVPFKPA
jgi:uncharacterized protein (TIGR00369 family)